MQLPLAKYVVDTVITATLDACEVGAHPVNNHLRVATTSGR